MFNKNYYLQKQQQLNQKIKKIKDQYIGDMINMNQRLVNDIKEIQADYAEIEKIIKENEETKEEKETKPIKKNKYGKNNNKN